MSKINQTEQREIGRIKLSDGQDLVASLIDNEKLDRRIFRLIAIQGLLREASDFIFLIINRIELKRLTDKVDTAYNEIG